MICDTWHTLVVVVCDFGGMVEWLILCCFGNRVTDGQMVEHTDIGGCRGAFATENLPICKRSFDLAGYDVEGRR